MRSIVSIRHSVHTARTVVLTMIQDLPLTICARLCFFLSYLHSFNRNYVELLDHRRLRRWFISSTCVCATIEKFDCFVHRNILFKCWILGLSTSSLKYSICIYLYFQKKEEKLWILFLFSAVDKWIYSEIQITTKQRTRNCVSCVQAFINKCVACIDIRYMSSDRLIYKCN